MRPEEALITSDESLTNENVTAARLPLIRIPCPPETAVTPDVLIRQWNLSVISQLLEIQKRDKHGCFFISLAKITAQINPGVCLPSASDFLNDVRAKYSQLLNGLDVRHEQTAAAFTLVLPDFGLEVCEFTLIKDADRLLGAHLLGSTIKITRTGNNQVINTADYPSPVMFFWHQFGGCNSHWTAKTDFDNARDQEILNEYTTLRYPYETQGVLRLRSNYSLPVGLRGE